MGFFDAKPTAAQQRLAAGQRFTIPRAESLDTTFIGRLGHGGGVHEPPVTVAALKQFLATLPDDWVLGVELNQGAVLGVPIPATTGELIAFPPA